jgi:hypothetical protein
MPQPRPLEPLGIAELQDLAFTHWTSQRTLKEIEQELSFRSLPTAMEFCDEIRNRLATFANAGSGEGRGAEGPPQTAPTGASHDPFWAQAGHRLFSSLARARGAAGERLRRAKTHRFRMELRAHTKALLGLGTSGGPSALKRFVSEFGKGQSSRSGVLVRAGATTSLEAELVEARQRIAVLEQHRASLVSELGEAHERIAALEQEASVRLEGGTPLLRSVGLDESCPDFVIKAVRTAYRKTFHPDTRPDHQKAEAERRFKEAEAVFEEIYWQRGIKD